MILDIYSSLVFPIGITSFIRLLFIDKGSDSVCNNQIKKGKSKQISKNLSLNGCQHRDVPLVPFYGQPHTTQSHPSGTTCRTRRVRLVVPDGCGFDVCWGCMELLLAVSKKRCTFAPKTISHDRRIANKGAARTGGE